jgi:hypothetical protein
LILIDLINICIMATASTRQHPQMMLSDVSHTIKEVATRKYDCKFVAAAVIL